MALDALAARVAQHQRGLITHAQALQIGYTPKTIKMRLARGTWRVVRRGVYVVGGAPPTWEQTLLAVTLGFDDCWISHGTAGRLWPLPCPGEMDAIEVLRPYGKYRRLEGVLTHRSRILVPADVTRCRGIPVTSIARTIVECAGRLSVKETGKNIDAAMRMNKRSLEATRACYARLAGGGRRRLRSIRGALALRLPGYDPGESDLEIEVLRAILAAGLPMPTQQHRVVLNGKKRRIDLAYPELKIAIELLGWDPHSGREPWDDDKARAAELVSNGWRVLEITSRHAAEDYIRWITSTIAIAGAAA